MKRLLAGLCFCTWVAATALPQEHLACWELIEQRDAPAAATCLQRAVTGNDHSCEALALRGALALLKGDGASAERHSVAALGIFNATDDPWRLAIWIHRTLGLVRYDSGDYTTSLGHYREILALCLRHDTADTHMIGRAHYNIGNNFWGMDQRDSCKAHYHEALAQWGRTDNSRNPVIAYIHEVLGTYAWEEGNEALALEQFNMAAARHLKTAPTSDEADRLATAAQGEAQEGRSEEALRLYQEALAFRVRYYGAAHPNTACMHTDLARMLVAMARPEDAMARAQEAIALLLPGFSPKSIWENPADVNNATNHRHLLDALLVKFRLLTKEAGNARADRAADEVIDRALECIEHLCTGAHMEGSKLFWTTQVRGFFEEALEHCHRRWPVADEAGGVARTLYIMDLSRNALLTEAMRSMEAATTAGLPTELANEERQLRSRIAETGRYLLMEEKKCERMDADRAGLWRRSLSADQTALEQLVLRIAVEHPAYHTLKYGSSAVDQRALTDRLGTDRSLLCMFQGDSAAYFLLLDSEGAELVKRAVVTSTLEASRWLRAFLSDRQLSLKDPQGSCERFVAAARTVHDAVFGGFARPLRHHVVIVPDADFHRLPFEVLLTGDVQGQACDYRQLPYLIRDRIVSYAPSVGALMNAASGRAEGEYLGMAAQYDGPGATALRTNADEVEAVKTLLGGETFTGSAATEARFKTHAAHASVIHLAMHTALDDLDPMNSALDFGRSDSANDGRLNLFELYGMKLVARLAVLSACRTGDGRLLHGEGLMSAARGFAYAGCPSTVMGLWDLEDAATGAIVRDFFDRAKDGAPLDVALRDAKLRHLEQSDPAKAHPFYWSALVLMGDERPILLSRPWYKRAWIWVALGGALLLVTLRSRIAKLF